MSRFIPTLLAAQAHQAKGQCFVRGTSAEQREFPQIAGRNTKGNIFCKGGARFEAIVDLNKKKRPSR
jgi:hypothetical protein